MRLLPIAAVAVLVACRPAHLLSYRSAVAPTPQTEGAVRVPVGPMYWVLDGQRLGVDSTGAIAASIQHLDPQTIRNVEVLKGRKAIERFGQEASGGVVIVTTRASRAEGEGGG